MPQCVVICLYLYAGRVGMTREVLPPMRLPQSLLPDGARFAGVGSINADDAYLYVVSASCKGKMQPIHDVQGELAHLIAIAQKDVPQDFVLALENDEWGLTTRDLDQDVF